MFYVIFLTSCNNQQKCAALHNRLSKKENVDFLKRKPVNNVNNLVMQGFFRNNFVGLLPLQDARFGPQ